MFLRHSAQCAEKVNTFTNYIDYQLATPQWKYGNDYVEYDDSIYPEKDKIKEELDLLLLDIDDEDDEIDDLFGTELEIDDETLDADESTDKKTEETIKDEYEFNDVDPEIFRDPTLLVKWLGKNE